MYNLKFQQKLYTEEDVNDLLAEIPRDCPKIVILNFNENEQDAYDAIRSKFQLIWMT